MTACSYVLEPQTDTGYVFLVEILAMLVRRARLSSPQFAAIRYNNAEAAPR